MSENKQIPVPDSGNGEPTVRGSKVTNSKFINSYVNVDDCLFIKCEFENATFVYRGGEFPAFKECNFKGSTNWQFDGPAGNTLNLVQSLYSITPFRTVAEAVISAIKGRWRHMILNFDGSTYTESTSALIADISNRSKLHFNEITHEEQAHMSTPSREEFDAKIEAVEARMDTRVGVVIAKIDAMEVFVKSQMERATAAAESAAKSAEKASELKQTLWVTAIATIISVLGIAFGAYYGMQQSNIGLVQAVTAMFQLGQQNPPAAANSAITPSPIPNSSGWATRCGLCASALPKLFARTGRAYRPMG